MIAYKVVRRVAYKLFSILYEDLGEKNSVEYKPGEFVEAKVGFLFAFDTLESALIWGKNLSQREIWECECGENKKPPVGILSWWYLDDRRLINIFWRFYEEGRIPSEHISRMPRGTIFVKKIKLTRRIEV